MSSVIDFKSDPENSGIAKEIRRIRKVLSSIEDNVIKEAIKLLKENGYVVKKR